MLIYNHFCIMEIIGCPGSLLSFVIQLLLHIIGRLQESLDFFLLQPCLVGLKGFLLLLLLEELLMQVLLFFDILITFCLIFSRYGRQLPIFVLDHSVQLRSFGCCRCCLLLS